jgi:Fuc2NAc and GlcNAc transferase
MCAATLAGCAALTYATRRFSLASGLLDVPNARSSHALPTPTGGGVAIVLTATCAFALLTLRGLLDARVFAALAGGVPVAFVGYLDDRRPISVRSRLLVHLVAAVWALAWLGGLAPLRLGSVMWTPHVLGYVLGVLGIIWTINLFNFMDGIDGIAASEAVFVTWAAALLRSAAGLWSGLTTTDSLFGASCAGFLFWNWAPARIFMGDVGSGYVGYVVAVLALAAAREDPVAWLVWLTLGAVFLADATTTLVRRALRGERASEAHRSHAYQWLARRWRGHGRTTFAVTVVNVAWLLPAAYLEGRFPLAAGWIAAAAIISVALLAMALGAGRAELPVSPGNTRSLTRATAQSADSGGRSSHP